MESIYLDYNAGAPLNGKVRAYLNTLLTEESFLNPSSPHKGGQKTRGLIEEARAILAQSFGLRENHVLFTSSGSEANNLALLQAAEKYTCFVVENAHPSLRFAIDQGLAISVKPNQDGRIKLDELEEQFKAVERPPFLGLIWAHNETGVIEAIEAVADLVKEYDGWLHIDAVQAIGKLSLEPILKLIDSGLAGSLTLSGHKLGGLSGVGAWINFRPHAPTALISGGGQERGFRAGTENAVGIAALGHAFKEALTNQATNSQSCLALRQKLEQAVKQINPKAIIAGEAVERLPNTTQLITPNIKSERQLIHFDLHGVMLSAGAACSSGKVGANPALTATGFSDEAASSAIRISMGSTTRPSDIDHFIETYRLLVNG